MLWIDYALAIGFTWLPWHLKVTKGGNGKISVAAIERVVKCKNLPRYLEEVKTVIG